jgi:hypothetical protein
MGGRSPDALSLCELLANADPARYERAALRWLQRFIDKRLPPLTEVALANSALAELRHGQRDTGVKTLKTVASPWVAENGSPRCVFTRSPSLTTRKR